MIQRFRSKRRLLVAAVTVMSLGAVVGAGYAYSAITDTGNVYTGCLANGSIQYVAIGPSPQKKCTNPAVQISWSQTGPKGDEGVQGLPGTNGAPGVSPTVTALKAGDDSNCPAGGAKITDANNSTAYVCSGQNGQPGADGAPFSGTFTSGAYSISVTSTGILLAGPGPTTIGLNGTGLTMRSNNPIDIRGDGIVGVRAGTINLTASQDALVQAGANLNLNGGGAVNAQSSGAFAINAAGVLSLNGGIMRLNGSAGCLPAARVTDPIAGTAAADNAVTGEITAGANTVCVGG